MEDRPTLFTDPAGEDVLLGIRLSVLFAEFLAELVFCVLVYVSSVKIGLGVKLLKKYNITNIKCITLLITSIQLILLLAIC